MNEGVTLTLIAVVILAVAFDYINGFHDTANAIATSVATKALHPDRKSTRLNSSHSQQSRMPSSA